METLVIPEPDAVATRKAHVFAIEDSPRVSGEPINQKHEPCKDAPLAIEDEDCTQKYEPMPDKDDCAPDEPMPLASQQLQEDEPMPSKDECAPDEPMPNKDECAPDEPMPPSNTAEVVPKKRHSSKGPVHEGSAKSARVYSSSAPEPALEATATASKTATSDDHAFWQQDVYCIFRALMHYTQHCFIYMIILT